LTDKELGTFSSALAVFSFNALVVAWNKKEVLSLGESTHTKVPTKQNKYPPVPETEQLLLC